MSVNNVTFCLSQELDIPLRVKLRSLEGVKQLSKPSEKILNPKLTQVESNLYHNSNFLVSVQVFDNERHRNLTLPVFTPYIPFKNSRKWDYWVTLPIMIKQLTLSSRLRIILWEYNGMKKVAFYKLETCIFNYNDCSLKRGYESLKFDYEVPNTVTSIEDDEVQENLNKYLQGEIKKIDWLDDITFKKLVEEREKRTWPRNTFVLNIEFPVFELLVIYTERMDENVQKNISTLHNFESVTDMTEHSKTSPDIKISLGDKYTSTLKFYDPDQFNSDPIEEKYRRLERTSKQSDLDKQVKPDTKKRKYLNKIINYPPGTALTAHEKGSIWKYRYFLMTNKKALTKLLRSTNLSEETERNEVLELMDSWAEIDIDDAIELLGPDFTNLSVRSYAVNRLKKASDKDLELYLLQLVQAVCFENLSVLNDKTNSEFQIVNTPASPNVVNSTMIQRYQKLERSVQSSEDGQINDMTMEETTIVISPLAEFLIKRALKNPRLGNFFYWYLKSECEDRPYLKQILDSFLDRLPSGQKVTLFEQIEFVTLLSRCSEEIKKSKDTTTKKIELLHSLLTTKIRHMLKNKPIPLPLNPDIFVCDASPEQSTVFKSSLSPLMISFKTTDNLPYQLMYKVGDDLRQDQLVIQIIRLMDELLKSENVDLKLSPYLTLATGIQEGAIQFVPSSTLASILSNYHGILFYLKAHFPDDSQELGVQDLVMENFVKSCAGYSVITYILGVGDRHLDNLLLTPDGHFFHADFGYILGQDPKPFPPLMKLPPQIIEAFGGAESSNYDKFRSYCFVAYSILRRNAGLILNLFELMKQSNIPDIRVDPDGAILKVKERFNLDISEEEAIIHFQTLINDSVNALLPIVIDRLHNLAQYWRA
ncbi:hypothetical protein KAFR_0H01890 [Kazachstania africana CBS 2517]|uniref:Phosphatidylinositol 3-kinase VPS34 n=1 Tax=Kazachstania africana (strain ATCC 22294 / BCRC 22015 / CBS 2517 / CECT 1963 / NBRC 1671 / NRRL Y-8276) TaxID=1071382 RepID=H2AZ42_KAZAF|nr:hypothetical protein KAFR_0H01890 [Kazachstania africana CBS 2517]CCF59598.1 hypothetical protein KAFR_0H01890 [Kazachstania africana CBS 2517]